MQALELQQLEFLFYLLLGLVFLILIILIAYVVSANRRQRARLAKAYTEDSPSPRSARRIAGQILSLVRDQPGAPAKVDIEGVRYSSLAEIEDPVVRRQVVDAALELIQFTGVLGRDTRVPTGMEQTGTWREDIRDRSHGELKQIRAGAAMPGAQKRLSPEETEMEEQFLSLLEDMGGIRSTPERPTVVSSMRQRVTAKPSSSEQPHSFVSDIEEIVQRRIRLIPALVGRDLHIRLDMADSVWFTFEGKEYKDLQDLPNLTARQLITDAIREWEETL